MKLVTALLLATLFLAGCQPQQFTQPLTNASETVQEKVGEEQQKQANKTQALIKCQELCQNALVTDGENFEVGVCLSNSVAPDWVCDVAHQPRQDIDDDPANQCDAYRQGRASHFVEVDGNCNVIRAR